MSHPAWQCKRNVPMTEAVVAVSKAQGEEPRCVLSSVTLNKHCLHGAAPMFSLESEHTWSTRKSWLFLFGVISHSLTLFLFSSFRLREWERERGGRLRAWDRKKEKERGRRKENTLIYKCQKHFFVPLLYFRNVHTFLWSLTSHIPFWYFYMLW